MRNLTEVIPINSYIFLNGVGESQHAKLGAPYPVLYHVVILAVEEEPGSPHIPKVNQRLLS